ncbi:mitochondrial ribosomal protein L35 [Megachile rotundata]|uniref:mitochondrial ribosomal protein L35 n=1 Tax=Megachile rotundata TaxID=143995 RepID=UPI000258DB33|nr:PREDICTED: 39S ribosomal protein L35, mitochondrial [Megachile rotundata]
MLRIVSTAIRGIAACTNASLKNPTLFKQLPAAENAQQRYFGALSSINKWNNVADIKQKAILGQTHVGCVVPPTLTPVKTSVRTVIKFSRNKGKRKTVSTVTDRFYRLNWGIWIRTIAGRNSGNWRKSDKQLRRRLSHVFCNATQSYMLDKMVTKFWKRPHFYVDDPYTPYHTREEFPFTRKRPLP